MSEDWEDQKSKETYMAPGTYNLNKNSPFSFTNIKIVKTM